MEELQKENAELKEKVKKLTEENKKLRCRVDFLKEHEKMAKDCVNGFIEKYGDVVPGASKFPGGPSRQIVDLDTVKYIDQARPVLCINRARIQFEKSTDRTAEVARVIFTPSHLKKLSKKFIPVAEIYEWFKYSEDWDSLHRNEREKFKKDFYQWLHRLDEKIAPNFGNHKMFEMVSHEYRISPRIILTKARK